MCRVLAALPSISIERVKELKVRLGQFLHKSEAINECDSLSPVKQDKLTKMVQASAEDTQGSQFFEKLLANKRAVAAFRAFLCSEFSEKNIDFWLACEDYKNTKTTSKLVFKVQKIYG